MTAFTDASGDDRGRGANLSGSSPSLERFFDLSPDLLCILSVDGLILRINPALQRTLDLNSDGCVGRPFAALAHPDDREETAAVVALSAQGAAPQRVTNRCRRADGSYRRIQWTVVSDVTVGALFATGHAEDAAVADAAGGSGVISGRDVTTRKQAGSALRENEERLRQAVRVSDIGIFDHDHIADTVYWSPRQREIYGCSPDEPITLADFLAFVHPEDAERVAASVRRSHDPSGTGSWEVEHRIVRRDGSTRWLIARSQTFFDGAGAARRPVRTIGADIDITERKRAEEALRRSEAMLRLFYDLPFLGMAITSPETKRWAQVNQTLCDMLGYPREELLQKTWTELTHPDDLAANLADFDRAMRGETDGYKIDKRFIRRDGAVIYATMDVKCVRAADGRVDFFVATVADISEAKRLQAQLLQSQKIETVGRLAGGVAHDFNNLLTVIKGYLEVALGGLEPDHPACRHLAEVNKAAESAVSLTQRLLAFSRKQVINPQVLDLNLVIVRVQQMLQRLLGEDIRLTATTTPDLWCVRFDPGQSEQVLVNLAVNARDAMPDGGTLTLETANVRLNEDDARLHPGMEPGEYVMLAVSDTGSGMSPDVQAHLFEPFFTTKGPGRGTGLGLAMVYGAVSQNGGRVDVSSEVGHGTTFRIYLPRVADAGALVAVGADGARPRGTETIVLVEDEEAVRSLASLLLARQGYMVHAFGSGPEAIDALGAMTEPVHLLMTDVVMPEMNGRVLAERVVALRPAIRVLFTSGYTADAIVHHGVLDEGVEFLPKPYTVGSLARRVREVLDKPAG